MAKSTAVFLDRDGTIIEDCGYIGDPDDVRLLPGAADALRRLRRAGYLVVVVSNQSGVARGLFDEQALSDVHARLERALEAHGAGLDGAYYCPYLDGPEAAVDAYRRDSELRKPRPGMLLQAARELDIDLARSWMIGDSASDVEAGKRAGCRTVFITGDRGHRSDEGTEAVHRARDLLDAAKVILNDKSHDNAGERDRAAPGNEDRLAPLLEQIRDRLDRAHRIGRQQDFSMLRLFGALLQMFAIVVALWGGAALLHDHAAPATARFALACYLQLASATALAVDRFR